MGGGLFPEQCVLLLPCIHLSWLLPGPGALAVLNPPGPRPALPSATGITLLALLREWLCLLRWGCSDAGEGPSTEEVPVPALSPLLRAGAGLAVAEPSAAACPLPKLLTNGKAELRLDATDCSIWFYTLKKLISSIAQGSFPWQKNCQMILLHSSEHKQELGGGTKLQTKHGGVCYML